MPADPHINLLVVEDNSLIREQLLIQFEADSRFQHIVAANNFSNAIPLADSRTDVVLLDIHLPDGNGLDLIPIFRSANPNIKFLVFTVFEDENTTLQAIERGIDGYVMKDDPDLVERIVSVAAGSKPLDSRITQHLITRLANDAPNPTLNLTPREHQTLGGLYRGMSYNELATHMNVSRHTVPGYIKNLYRKLDVSSRSQAVYKATQMGLVANKQT